jgi:hypothetical protein
MPLERGFVNDADYAPFIACDGGSESRFQLIENTDQAGRYALVTNGHIVVSPLPVKRGRDPLWMQSDTRQRITP